MANLQYPICVPLGPSHDRPDPTLPESLLSMHQIEVILDLCHQAPKLELNFVMPEKATVTHRKYISASPTPTPGSSGLRKMFELFN